MKKRYESPEMERILFRLSKDILGDSTETNIPVIDVEIPGEEPSEFDDLWG